MTQVVLFNGPPRCGKDTAAAYLEAALSGSFDEAHVGKFAKILKERTHALYLGHALAHDFFEHSKDVENPGFLGLTPRQAYINVSEKYLKPTHGEMVLGKMFVQAHLATQGFLLVSDSGFKPEAIPVVEHFGADNVMLVRIHREGCDFSNDSRSYIDLSDVGVKHWDIFNNGTIQEFEEVLTRTVLDEVTGRAMHGA